MVLVVVGVVLVVDVELLVVVGVVDVLYVLRYIKKCNQH